MAWAIPSAQKSAKSPLESAEGLLSMHYAYSPFLCFMRRVHDHPGRKFAAKSSQTPSLLCLVARIVAAGHHVQVDLEFQWQQPRG